MLLLFLQNGRSIDRDPTKVINFYFILVRILNTHDQFTSSIILLEQKQQTRLDRIEKTKSRLRKNACPRLGKLILEASSFRDAIMYGMPRLGKEIGRGQYGVVAEADNWGQRRRIAVKSIVPERECHWGDLAFEFYYTKWWLEPHPHIVKLYGSVIDENYGPGNGLQPAVLLIMERLSRDLYTAIKQVNLNFKTLNLKNLNLKIKNLN